MDTAVTHRYAGRRAEIHGDIAVRMRTKTPVGANLRELFPSARRLGRIVGGVGLAGGAVAMSASPVLADHLDEEHDLADGGDTFDEPDNDNDLHITGGDGDDTITTGDGDNDIEDPGGSNTITTGDGNDDIDVNGDGDNTIDSGGGLDDIDIDGDGDNTVNAGDGHDEVVINGDGNNTVNAGDGDDLVLIDGQGENAIDAGAGSDFLSGGDGDDTIDGGDDNDWIDGDRWLSGIGTKEDTGDDVISGGSGNDAVFGDFDSSAEICFLVETPFTVDCGDDTVSGDAGNDWVEGNLGDDDVDGGAGDDVVIGDDLVHYLYQEFGYEGSYEYLFDLLDGDVSGLSAEQQETIIEFLELAGFLTPGGNDVVQGGDGADIVAGMGGHDVVCGDADDLAVLGGGGTDVPCAVFEETVDASSGSAAGDLSTDMRDLDDEDLEVDEDGNHNPYEFVIDATLVSSNGDIDTYKTAKGTVHLNRVTGAFTYVADPGATGTEDISYTVRRVVVECPDYPAGELDDAFALGCEPEIEPLAAVIEDVDGVDYLYSLWQVFHMFLGDPPVDPVDPVVPVEATDATPAELPKTGTDPEDLALAGFALLALGGLATVESRRRQRAHAG